MITHNPHRSDFKKALMAFRAAPGAPVPSSGASEKRAGPLFGALRGSRVVYEIEKPCVVIGRGEGSDILLDV